MFADHRHPQVRPVLAAIGFGRRETPVSRLVGTARRLLQQRLPLVTRQTLIVPVGAAMLAAMVEEADIVVRCLKRLDLGRDRSEEHTSELQSLMRISYAVFCLKKKK